ncbi:nucleotidyltransferase domain-containing protein [Acidithiobacillus sp. IBUN Pt1247-S3]|uniref:nucleotidyltransferase domain-containing protein n=1 Tax=Acidithiobacillus sp. IBUN Pt1247-S3 TaxID=3166642 RepID=UPI0034E3ACBD
MRLTPEQVAIIRQSTAANFGPEARVWLFGSRVDDNQRGGDVDLLVETAQDIQEPAWASAQLAVQISRQLDDRSVDVLLSAPNLRQLAIHQIARAEGILL